jgi:pentatricopeptide repeat protein
VNTMLRCYLLQKDSNGAEKLFKYIKDTNKKLLKVSSFNLLIEHFAQRGQLEKSIHYFEEMKSLKMTPDRFSCSSILQGISKEGDVHKLLEWIKDIEKDGMKMDEQMYRAVVFTLEPKQDALNMDTKLMLKNAKLSLELNSKLGELVESDATPEEAGSGISVKFLMM